MVLSLLAAWMERRDGSEDFQSWSARQTDEDLEKLLASPRGRGLGEGANANPRITDAGMNAMAPPLPLIPENAPFSPQQRAWLNGFLAGLYGGASAGVSIAPAPAPPESEEFPWHDPVLELPERLDMAEGRPLPQRLMAAMGQLDCGQCGYMCQTYAEALAEGREGSVSLCVPGAKPTQLALKRLLAEAPALPAAPQTKPAPAVPVGREVRVVAAEPLTGRGSSKDVRHVVIDLHGVGPRLRPRRLTQHRGPNDPALVDATLAALGASDDEALRQALTHELDIARPLDRTLDLLAMAARASEARRRVARAVRRRRTARNPPMPDLLDLLAGISLRPPAARRSGALAAAAAAAAVFDRLLAARDAERDPSCASRWCVRRGGAGCATASQAASWPIAPSVRTDPRQHPGQPLPPARRSAHPCHHVRPRHRRRAVPRLPAGTRGARHQGTRLAAVRRTPARARLPVRSAN